MNKLKTLLIVTLAIGLVTVFAGSALATDYYVDESTGTDGSAITGTQSDPFASISGVFSNISLTSDDTIYVDDDSDAYEETYGSNEGLTVDVGVTIVAKDWNDDDSGQLVTIESNTSMTSDNEDQAVIKITAPGVAIHGTDSDSDGEVVHGGSEDVTFKLENGAASGDSADLGYGVKLDTADVGTSTFTLKDIEVDGSAEGASGIKKAGLYVTTNSSSTANGTVTNWVADTFTAASPAAGIFLEDGGAGVSVDIKESALGSDSGANTNGIKLADSDTSAGDFNGSTVSKNVIDFDYSTNGTGIRLEGKNLDVTRNYLYGGGGGNTEYGIVLGDGSNSLEVDDNTFKGNQIEDAHYGVYVNSDEASGNTFEQNYVKLGGSGSASIYMVSEVGQNNVFNYNYIGNDGTDDSALNVQTAQSNDIDATQNYWGTDSLSTVFDKVNNDDLVDIVSIKKAIDLEDVVVDADYIDSEYDLFGQARISLDSDSNTTGKDIYGYNKFGQIDSNTYLAPLDLTLDGSTTERSSYLTVHVEPIAGSNEDYEGDSSPTPSKFVFSDKYTKLVSEADTNRAIKLLNTLKVTADNVQIGATGKGFTINVSDFTGTGAGLYKNSAIYNNSKSLDVYDNKIVIANLDDSSNAQGIYNDGGGALTVGSSLFLVDNDGATSKNTRGILSIDAGNLDVTGSTFKGITVGSNATFGLKIKNSSSNVDTTLTNNTFQNLEGVQAQDQNNVTVTSNEFTEIPDHALLINTVDQSTTGAISVTENTFSDTGRGVIFQQDYNDNGNNITTAATVEVQKNKFLNADRGDEASSSQDGYALATGDAEYDNSKFGGGDIEADVNAKYNYWGAESGPYDPVDNPDGEGSRVDNDVTYDPYWTKVSGFGTTRGLKSQTVRTDRVGNLSLISADSFYTHLYTLHLDLEVV